MSQSQVKDGMIYFSGGSRGVLLFHAYTGSPNDVRMLGRFLNGHGYSVGLPTFSGHGTVDPENILSKGPADWWEDVKASIDFLKRQGVKEIAVFGLSLGGVYGIKCLEEYGDELVGGGAFSSPVLPETENNIFPVFLDYARKLIKNNGASQLTENRRMENIEYQLTKQLEAIKQLQTEVRMKLGEIKQPVMLVQGGRDRLIDPEAIFEAVKYFTQTEPRVFLYPNSGHVVTIGNERRQFQEDVLSFLTDIQWTKETG
ncbi:alpha/beta hydrolase [Vagococcus elongatus]|uniref:Serine aminopeptidase S33 domain-containing protein n=1 Tax=Vagococcus elongatus TaxID=180344 RepID=A0A430AX47_9ENTE|nr:alpha/beta hydrolase [Vagococcus elongatus]RSU12628.1 hypothetical protein CBF29_05725 [Vagococcus elongatus]